MQNRKRVLNGLHIMCLVTWISPYEKNSLFFCFSSVAITISLQRKRKVFMDPLNVQWSGYPSICPRLFRICFHKAKTQPSSFYQHLCLHWPKMATNHIIQINSSSIQYGLRVIQNSKLNSYKSNRDIFMKRKV